MQVENGYTEIANELIEALAQTSLRSTEWQVVIYLIRTTYGWHKKYAKLSVHEVALGTNLRDEMAARAIRQLRARNIITAVGDDHHPKTYSVQKDYEKWQGDYSQVTTGKSLPNSSHYRKVTTSESGKSLPNGSQSDYQTVVPLPYSKERKEKKEREDDAAPSAKPTRPDIDGRAWASQNLADPMNPWYQVAQILRRLFPSLRSSTNVWLAEKLRDRYGDVATPEELKRRAEDLHAAGVTDCEWWNLFTDRSKPAASDEPRYRTSDEVMADVERELATLRGEAAE
ncbi:MAG: replication protein [Armatimonadetes bacterium]|nr:replication protein [Armatimonadota bacterium]